MVDPISAQVPALAAATEAKRVLVFAGSGISKAPPSCLPDWAGFNASLLDPIKASALSIPGFNLAAREAIETLTVESARALAFSDFLVRELAGESYLPVLQVLDSPDPNAYHGVLAELARAGFVRAIVTTNFDTLIETAFREAAVPLATYVTEDDYRRARSDDDACALFKIHGSVASATTLRDTVSQKLRGLPLYVRARLAALYREHHVLVVGFSGADLEFGNDYLAFSAITSSGPGITWMVRPTGSADDPVIARASSPLPELSQTIVDRAGSRGAVIEADFLRLGALLGAVGSVKAVTDPGEVQEAADEHARTWVAGWFETLGRTPLQCALFCSQFLRFAGRQQDADAINADLGPYLSAIREEDPLSAANLALVLADNAKEWGETDRIAWFSRFALDVADALDAPPSEPTAALWTKLQAVAWSNLGYVHLVRNEHEGARQALEISKRFAGSLDDPSTLGSAYLNEALLTESLERRLELIRQAAALTLRGASGEPAYVHRQFEALTLGRLAEYDPALNALKEARRLVKLAQEPLRGRLSIEVADADIKRLRGQPEQAYRQLLEFLPRLDAHPLLAAQTRLNMLDMLESFPSLRPALVCEVDWILEQMANGLIPSDGSAANLPDESALRARQTRLQMDAPPPLDFLRFAGPPHGPEDQLRRGIVELEFHGRLSELPSCFDALGRFKYGQRDAWRLLDSAEALIAACERAGNDPLRLEGLHRKSIASQNLGDIWASIDVLEAILRAQPPAPLPLQALVERDLGTAFSRIGNHAETEGRFHEALVHHMALGELGETVGDVFDFADALLRFNDLPAALAVLNDAAVLIASIGRPELDEKWNAVRALIEGFIARSGADLLELPAGFAPTIERPVPIATIEDERRCAESAEELRLLARDASRSGHHELAVDLALQAQQEFVRGHDPYGVAQTIHDLGEIAQARGHWAHARELSTWALNLRTRLGDVAGRIESGAANALGFFQLGQYEEAGDAAQAALVLAAGHPASRSILTAWCVLATVFERIGSPADCRALLVRFLAEFPPDDRQPLLTAVRGRFQGALKADVPGGAAHEEKTRR